MPKKYFKNHKAFWKAVKKTADIQRWAEAAQNRLGKNPAIPYDQRNLYALAMLAIDLDNIPEAEQEGYYTAEYERMHSAFSTPHPDTPNKPDPEAIKPYIQMMYDNVVTDLSAIDYNDPKQIKKVLFTMLSTQMLATMVVDFPKECMELSPTHEDKKRIDAISAKAFGVQLEARVIMSYEGLDEVGNYFMTMGSHKQESTAQMLQSELIHTVFDSALNGNDLIVIDPAKSELASKFFLKKPFEVRNNLGGQIVPFTDEDYGKYYAEHLADSIMNTSFEYLLFNPSATESDTMSQRDILLINGKPMQKLLKELRDSGLNYDDADKAVGKALRDALLQGDPVTLVSSTYTNDGKLAFHNKDLRLDLDKLNALDRANYNIFRRALDKVGLWTIPKKYPTNEARDAKLTAVLSDPNSIHQKEVKAIENEYIRSFNTLNRSKSALKGCATVIESITRDEAVNVNQPINAVLESNAQREPLLGIDLESDRELPVEPIKDADEKVIKTEPLAK